MPSNNLYSNGMHQLSDATLCSTVEKCSITSDSTLHPPICFILYHTCTLHTNSGRGKRNAYIDWSIVIPEKASPVTATT